MKKIVENKPTEEITITDLLNNTYMLNKLLFAYKSKGNSGWCFLAKLTESSAVIQRWGFVAMNYTDTYPRFCESSLQASLKLAVKSREVFVFNGVDELSYIIINHK